MIKEFSFLKQQLFIKDHHQIGILGNGLTARSLKRFFDALGYTLVTCLDIDDVLAWHETIPQLDVLFVSPGISPDKACIAYANEQSTFIMTDIDLFMQIKEGLTIGITGTNGKSTLCAMTVFLLEECDPEIKAVLCGNFGIPVLDAWLDWWEQSETKDASNLFWVIELSSYQLHYSQEILLDVAVIINVAPDHIDWHQGYQHYIESKAKILKRAQSIILNQQLPFDFKRSVQSISDDKLTYINLIPGANLESWHLMEQNHSLVFCYGDRLFKHDQPLSNHHYYQENWLFVFAIISQLKGRAYMLDFLENHVNVLLNFKYLPHRLEWVACLKGVTYINDSKATNFSAVNKAFEALNSYKGRIHLLLGGQLKEKLVDLEADRASHYVKAVYPFGQDGVYLHRLFSKYALSSGVYTQMQDAFNAAVEAAEAGELVLLSPAGASFDEFTNYQARGDTFICMVENLSST